ncbi:hypothetical protein PGS49_22535 [Yersinia intermedia]|uniref:hypothetical protein n=1 Tax=Yersinia intermedia TaxID=631 RepID=UPI0022FE10CD|nr:hypothetical protein [Yersinia intermedia]MDA5483381.1 hypothetical protein [Yersinia intermedia]
MPLCSVVAFAAISDNTGPIEGRAPVATGELKVMFPGGITAVTDDAFVVLSHKPSEFLASISGLVLSDEDEDTGLNSSFDAAAVTRTWKYNDIPLTPEQLAAPFGTYFANQTLTVAVSVPVTVTSLTGTPTYRVQTLSSATYRVKVPDFVVNPVVRVNGTSFAMDSGFPQTGFAGATFQFWMDGTPEANSHYTFVSNQSWVTVDATGTVRFVSTPATANKTVNIKITDSRDTSVRTYTFTVNTWFINNGEATAPEVDSWCQSQGYTTPGYALLTNAVRYTAATRTTGNLWSEWGSLSAYGSGWTSLTYWAREIDPNFAPDRHFVRSSDGQLNSYLIQGLRGVSCSKSL